jgi:hypothetical protein
VTNRLISIQLIKATELITQQLANSWYCIDILSDCDNNTTDNITNAMLKLEFSKLDGTGIAKWFIILQDGQLINLGEM